MCKEHGTYYKEAAVDGDETTRRMGSQLALCVEEQQWEPAAWTVILHAVGTDLLYFQWKENP